MALQSRPASWRCVSLWLVLAIGLFSSSQGARSSPRTGTVLHPHSIARSLLQTSPTAVGPPLAEEDVPPSVTIVNTEEEFVKNLSEGATDIELHAHLDLRNLPVGQVFDSTVLPELIPDATRSIRGNCKTAPQDPAIAKVAKHLPLKPAQCVIITPSSTFSISTYAWLDNLYIIQRGGQEVPTIPPALIIVEEGGKLYGTDLTVEGDGLTSQEGVRVELKAKAFFTQSRFRRLGAEEPVISSWADASFKAVTFENNFASGEGSLIPAGVLRAEKGNMRLEACAFNGNGHHFAVSMPDATSAQVWAEPRVRVKVENQGAGTYIESGLLLDVPPKDAQGKLFLSDKDPWFIAIRRELKPRPLPSLESAGTSGRSRHGAVASTSGHAHALQLHVLPKGPISIAPADVVEVTTAKELKDAVAAGRRDIIVKAHLDLGSLQPDDVGYLLVLKPSTRSIRGHCDPTAAIPPSLAATGAPLVNLKVNQCILSGPWGMFRLPSRAHLIWMDSLYLRTSAKPASPPPGSDVWGSPTLIDMSSASSMLFGTSLTLQGAPAGGHAVALWSSSSAIHFEETTFRDFTVPAGSSTITTVWGALSMTNCPLANLAAPMDLTAAFYVEQHGSITLRAMKACQGAACQGVHYMLSDLALIFSDGSPGTATVLNRDTKKTQPASPIAEVATDTTAGLDLDHPWFLGLSKALLAWDKEHGGKKPSERAPPTPALQQTFLPPPAITAVATSGQLLEAIDKGALDIVLTDHIDLRGMLTDALGYTLALSANTRSIRGGECPNKIPEGWKAGIQPEFHTLRNGQCVLFADNGVFHLTGHNHILWLHNLYVRLTTHVMPPGSSNLGVNSAPRVLAISGQGSTVYGTALTLQGDGGTAYKNHTGHQTMAVWSSRSSALFEDVNVRDFEVPVGGSALVNAWGPVSLRSVAFFRDVAPPGKALLFAENRGALRLESISTPESQGEIVMQTHGTTSGPASVFSDQARSVHVAATGKRETSAGLDAVPSGVTFPSKQDLWYQAVSQMLTNTPTPKAPASSVNETAPKQVIPPPPSPAAPGSNASDAGDDYSDTTGTDGPGSDSPVQQEAGRARLDTHGSPGDATTEASPPPSPPSNKGRSRVAAIAGVLGVLIPILCIVAMLFARRRYRRAQLTEWNSPGISQLPELGKKKSKRNRSMRGGYKLSDDGKASSPLNISVPDKAAPPHVPGAAPRPTPRGLTTTTTAEGATPASIDVKPLNAALDTLCASKGRFLHSYICLGPANRRVGRTAVVQLFEHADTRKKLAVKFYRIRAAFDRERAMYQNTEINPLCLRNHGINPEPGKGPGGYAWPPCILLDAGENLAAFLARAPQQDEATACAVMAEVAVLVEAMHDAGWAHRNIKPGNVLFVPERETWVLADVERAARVGLVAPPCPPCEYTAPEVWANMVGARTAPTTAAADVWALGALAFEITTGERVLQAGSQPRVEAEGLLERAEAAAAAGKLGRLKDVVLDCLAAAPQARPTARTIVPILQAEVESSKVDSDRMLSQLAQLAREADDYMGTRMYLQAVRSCTIIPLATRYKLPEPPMVQPAEEEMKRLIQEYCMALGPDSITFGKGVPLREQRLQAFRDINAQLNQVYRPQSNGF